MASVQNFQLTVTPETLTQKSSEITVQRSNVSNIMQQIQQIVQSLQGEVWSGEAASDFHTHFNTLYQNVEHMLTSIQGYIDDLTNSARIYTTAETQVKTAADGLQTTGVFMQ